MFLSLDYPFGEGSVVDNINFICPQKTTFKLQWMSYKFSFLGFDLCSRGFTILPSYISVPTVFGG